MKLLIAATIRVSSEVVSPFANASNPPPKKNYY